MKQGKQRVEMRGRLEAERKAGECGEYMGGRLELRTEAGESVCVKKREMLERVRAEWLKSV